MTTWQVDAAITSGFVHRPGGATASAGDDERDVPTAAELVALAVEHRDPHVVKFTEASLREHAIRPDAAYLLAARQVIERTPPW